MADVKQVRHNHENEVVVDRAKDFWTRNGRGVLIACGALVVLGAGWLAYKYLYKAPKEDKANEAIWRAQQYFATDSMMLSLKGDGQAMGTEKIASQYSGTDAGNLANYFAGAAALRTGDPVKAVKYLKDFSTSAGQIQARAYKLLGDAYADQGKTTEALTNYKKAATEFEKDEMLSAQYLFTAAYYADRVVNDKKQAAELYKDVRKKYSGSTNQLASRAASDAQRYLAQLGEYADE